ncbi:Late competence protein ComGG [Streptococcus parasanguinis]|nr:competence type IV pilus minor pilin ComGG [Streptococcus parasanguinis]KXT86917.1 Late competence protein ComGG [Streptococcus parasanguinis]
MKKVKAGVLLYALLMAAIFSLLLQFYLHRQVAERRILKTSQDRLRAYALVQMALEKRKSDEKTSEIHLKSGVVQLQQDTDFLHAQAKMDGESYEFVLPVREEKERKKTQKDKEQTGSEKPSEETPNETKEPSENSEKD